MEVITTVEVITSDEIDYKCWNILQVIEVITSGGSDYKWWK